jgi:hypothetical protein
VKNIGSRPVRALVTPHGAPTPGVLRGTAPGALAMLVLLAAVVLVGACGNPVSPRDDHVEPVGITIHAGDTQLVAATRSSVEGALVVANGSQSPVLTVRFVDATGATVQPGSDYHLAVVSSSAAVAEWQPQQPGAFTGTIAGRAVGSATLTFRWMHGRPGTGHSDLDIVVPVSVAPLIPTPAL